MTHIPQIPDPVNDLAAELDAADAACAGKPHEHYDGAYTGQPAPDFIINDPATPCMHCRLRQLQRDYYNALRPGALERARRLNEWTQSKNFRSALHKDELVEHARAVRQRARAYAAWYEELTARQQVEANVAVELAELEYEALWSGRVMYDNTFWNLPKVRDDLRAQREQLIEDFEDPSDIEADLWWLDNQLRIGPPVLEDVQ